MGPIICQLSLLLLQLVDALVTDDVGYFGQRSLLLELHDFLGLGKLDFRVGVHFEILPSLHDVGQTDPIIGLVQLVFSFHLFLLFRLLINKVNVPVRVNGGDGLVNFSFFLLMLAQIS